MSAIPVEQIKRNRHETGSLKHIPAPFRKRDLWRRRVKLCARCPYPRRNLAGRYDPEAILRLCANCEGEQKASTNEYTRKAERRQKCATIPNIPLPAQPSVARSAKENSVSSGAIPGGLRSVQRSALTASGPVRNVIADGYVGSNLLEHHATNSRSLEFLSGKEVAQ